MGFSSCNMTLAPHCLASIMFRMGIVVGSESVYSVLEFDELMEIVRAVVSAGNVKPERIKASAHKLALGVVINVYDGGIPPPTVYVGAAAATVETVVWAAVQTLPAGMVTGHGTGVSAVETRVPPLGVDVMVFPGFREKSPPQPVKNIIMDTIKPDINNCINNLTTTTKEFNGHHAHANLIAKTWQRLNNRNNCGDSV